ncbi:histone deacetylase family protein [Methylocella sp.]|uniref:histone deacetylase family protein n=1 Tax=Methylocella sp. TaxID=1978226 RepID=UPI0037846233
MNRRSFLRLGLAGAFVAARPPGLEDAAGRTPVKTLFVTHPAFLEHKPGVGHPERPERVSCVEAALAAPAFDGLCRAEAPLRDDVEAAILRAHGPEHLLRVKAVAGAGEFPYAFDGDTSVSTGSFEAAYRAVGAGLLAVDRLFDPARETVNAFLAVRPPGHHAERGRVMGFCLFNNVACAALYARKRHGVGRVAIVDFDVHHGNGTQQIFWEDRDVFFGSTHQMPLFPYTGEVSETGVGNIVNAPLRAGDGGDRFREAMAARILPALDVFRPDLILISAGFDGHFADPLGDLRLREEDFAWITMKLLDAADRLCHGRIVSFLEGGYSLDALERASAAHVGALMQAG